MHFIDSNLDKRTPHAVLVALIDFSKAFNQVDHSLVVEDLYDMHTPPWLLRIIVSYLSNRQMQLSYAGAQSSMKWLPAGGPQGSLLGGIIFIIKFKGALLHPPVPRPLTTALSKSESVSVKFIDDGSVGVSIDLTPLSYLLISHALIHETSENAQDIPYLIQIICCSTI